jgi:hypothetical protein
MRRRLLALLLASTSLLGGVALVAAAAPAAHAADLDGNAENTITAGINSLRAFFGGKASTSGPRCHGAATVITS